MKLATVSPGSREAMRERHRRGRIAAPPIRTRYPALKSLQLNFEFSDSTDFLPSPQVTVFHPPAPAYFLFACPYSDCGGEFDLTSLVDLAVSSRESQSSGQLPAPALGTAESRARSASSTRFRRIGRNKQPQRRTRPCQA